MTNVTYLAGIRHRDKIGTLRHLLDRAERGELEGFYFVVQEKATGRDVHGFTGSYRADPGRLGQLLARQAVRLCVVDGLEDSNGTGGP